ncbi:GGDEF domain-containing response regulator [Dokdonella koreensis]|uniref:GGDEF domain-containing response regulator n=1 Tax=Dokdonella koreensis TaxID=323415 RepID=UPI00082A564D|nr:GGDEF domain-containing response regulator [Dokdonella koreensis]
MSGILLVERSSTLSHLLRRTLNAAGLPPRAELASYLDAHDHLRKSVGANQAYSLAVIGAPPRSSREFLALLDYLGRNPTAPSAVILAHEASAEAGSWARTCRNGRLLLWSNFARLPAVIGELHPVGVSTAPVDVPAPVRDGQLRILFVDDSHSVRHAYRQLLERNGFAVDTAGSVAEALARTAAARHDLAIVDYFLPDGTGDELCRRLAAQPAAPLLAVITGTYRDDIIQRCLAAGAGECLFKTETKDLFLARVRRLARQIELERSADAERERLEGILGSVGDGVFGLDGEGRIGFVNPTALELLGHADDGPLLGTPIDRYVGGYGATARLLRETLAAGTPARGLEAVFLRADGTPLAVEYTLLPLHDPRQRNGAAVIFRDASGQHDVQRLHWELTHDHLTGLLNGRRFNELLAGELERLAEQGGYSALLYIDIDRFNQVIDAGGQPAADRMLVELAEALRQQLAEGDQAARLEGDRLAVLLSRIELDQLHAQAESYRALVRQRRYQAGGHWRAATASLGVAILGPGTPSVEHALEQARLACKTAKQRGRDQTEINSGQRDARVARELEAGWTERIRAALEHDRLVLLAQAIVPIGALPEDERDVVERQGWRINGGSHGDREYFFEVLTRMVGKGGQLITPSVFVPMAERVGLMPRFDLWVFRHLLGQIVRLPLPAVPVTFTVNLSGVTLDDAATLQAIEECVVASGVPPRRLMIEITETSELVSLRLARRFIGRMRALGCRFALDDFGIGFSSFSHLRDLDVDFVKIDGSFVEAMTTSDMDRKMIVSISQLAHSLGLQVIGEHVESFGSIQALRAAGVDYAQGHWIGEPRLLHKLDLTALLAPGQRPALEAAAAVDDVQR